MPIQLIAVRPGVATVQKDNESPVEMAWGLLHEAQQQDGAAGYVYRWLMHEFCRCEYEQRQGRPWQSPRREVAELVTNMRAQDARDAAEVLAARKEEERRQDAKDRLRKQEQESRRVEAERRQTADDDPWWPIPTWEVPAGVRFDTPGRNQGQIVEVSFGTFGSGEAGSTDPYMNVTDHGDGSSRTYRRRPLVTQEAVRHA